MRTRVVAGVAAVLVAAHAGAAPRPVPSPSLATSRPNLDPPTVEELGTAIARALR